MTTVGPCTNARSIVHVGDTHFGAEDTRALNALADDNTDDNDLEDFTEITRRINGGTVGIKERLLAFNAVDSRLA